MTDDPQSELSDDKKSMEDFEIDFESIASAMNEEDGVKNEERLRSLKEIYKSGLTDWFYEAAGIDYKKMSDLSTREIRIRMREIIDSVRTGDIFPAKIELIQQYAKRDIPVIIIGDTGTGKELLAKAIHSLSRRKNCPFQVVNAAQLTDELFVSEMFGHKKGAFTNAFYDKKGILQVVNNGSLFLDEIGKMSKPIQAKLLRVIEDKQIRRIGDTDETKINVRFIVALQEEEILKNKVLPDLLYRLGYPDVIKMQSLNERLRQYGHGIIFIAANKVARDLGIQDNENYPLTIGDDLIDALLKHNYKGNYRELENILRRLFLCADTYHDNNLSIEDIDDLLNNDNDTDNLGKEYPVLHLSKILEYDEKQLESLFLCNPEYLNHLDYQNISFSKIIDTAEKLVPLILKGMLMHIYKNEGDFKKAFLKDMPPKEYPAYMQKIGRKIKSTPEAWCKQKENE